MTRNRAAHKPMPPRRMAQLITALVCLVFYMGFGVYVVRFTQPIPELNPERPAPDIDRTGQ